MPGSKGPSRTNSKDLDKHKLNSNRTNSSRTDTSSARSQGSNPKLRQKLITTSLMKHEDAQKSTSNNSTSDSKDLKKGQSTLNHNSKVDIRNHKNAKDGKSSFDSSNKTLKQTTLTKSNSIESNKRSLTKSISSSYDNEDSDYENETPKNKNKSFKMNSTNSSSKSTPSKLSAKRSDSVDKDKNKTPTPTPKADNLSIKNGIELEHDDDLEVSPSKSKIANTNEYHRAHNLNHTLVNSSNLDNLCSNLNEEDNDKMNHEFRFKKSKRSHYKLQDSIMGLISKYQSDLEHLDDKIKSLEAQFFTNPAETIGLVKGWEGNVLNNAYTNLSNGLKSRRALNAKLKANFTQTQNLITEHIFSLTSSTCAVSKMLLNN